MKYIDGIKTQPDIIPEGVEQVDISGKIVLDRINQLSTQLSNKKKEQ